MRGLLIGLTGGIGLRALRLVIAFALWAVLRPGGWAVIAFAALIAANPR